MSDPDWKALRAVNKELDALHAAGKLTKADFKRLLEEATKAVGEHEEFLEGFLMRGREYGFKP